MKRLLGTLLLMLVMAVWSDKACSQDSGSLMIKSNTRLDLGCDIGVNFSERFGVKVGMMSDLYHPMGEDHEIIQEYKEALGEKYRLSYTAGPTVKLVDWLWLSGSIGYGEYGTYGYSNRLEKYGISGKIKGLEAGAQLRFVFGLFSIEVGYGTIPKGFSLNNPLHDISFGLGVNF